MQAKSRNPRLPKRNSKPTLAPGTKEAPLPFQCPICGEIHDGIPHLGSDRPDPWWDVPEEERSGRIELTSETCIIDDEEFFIRGVIEIPIHGCPDPFGFGVWVSQKKENFFQYLEKPDSSAIGPFFGWLCTRVACYQEDTFLLKTMAGTFGTANSGRRSSWSRPTIPWPSISGTESVRKGRGRLSTFT